MDLKKSPLAPKTFPDLPMVKGVTSTTFSLGMYGTGRDDLFLISFPKGTTCGGVFTRSLTRSCDVDWCREALERSNGTASSLVVNAGNSNAFTFQAGIDKNEATLNAIEAASGNPRHSCYIAATGVIGEPVAPDLIAQHVPDLWARLSDQTSWLSLTSAFMTTDTFPKASGRMIDIGGKPINIVGIAKGSGMIAPNMATMLAYVFTDAPLPATLCQQLVSELANESFNNITVDSDTSTSDTVMLFATGQSGHSSEEMDTGLASFKAALKDVFLDLAHQIVRDGEGATKFITVEVTGAVSDTSAKTIACSVANSPLVKTALAASDANWGRLVMAVGKSLEPIDRDEMSISIGDVLVAEHGGRASSYNEDAATKAVSGSEVEICIDVAVGDGRCKVWTCDLTHGYVDINGAYRT